MILLILIVLVLFIIGFALFANKICGLPPGPPPLPLIGNFLSFDTDGDAIDRKFLEWKKKYGNVFTVWIPMPMVVIGDHKTIIDTVVKEGDAYGNRYVRAFLNKLSFGGDYGLVMNGNDMWKEQRRFALHSLRDLGFGTSTVEDAITNLAQEAVRRWKLQHGQEIDATENIMAAVANTIWKLVFDKTLPFDDPLFPRLRSIVDEIFPMIMHPFLLLLELVPSLLKIDWLVGNPTKRTLQLNDEFMDILKAEIADARARDEPDSEPACYVHAFVREMEKRRSTKEGEGTFTEMQLVKASADMWGAGFETTVTTLRYALIFLLNNQNVQRKMEEEIDEKIGERMIRMDDAKILPYCCAVIQETQRIGNILPLNLPRQVAYDTTVEGMTLKQGTTVVPQFQMVHMNPDEFERPDYFCPERFINEQGEFVKDPRITPFSVGKRSCLGENLARMEIFVFLTTFIQHIQFCSPTVIPPKLESSLGFTKPPKPYTVVVKDRSRL